MNTQTDWSEFYDRELDMSHYLRKLSDDERKALEQFQEESLLEVSLQSTLGAKKYAPMLQVEVGTKEFQREAKRALKKVA